jgi:hypothetical protein
MSVPASYLGDYGALTHATDVDRAVIRHLQKWYPTYLAAAEKRAGKSTSWLARPAMYATTYEEDDEDFLSDRRMPTVFVTTGGFQAWQRTGDNNYSALCPLRISVVSRGRNPSEARFQASLYIATVTELLLAKQSLGGFANGIDVVTERPRPIQDPSNRSRHLAAGMAEYSVFVADIRNSVSGPLDPDDPPPDPTAPYEDLPDVSSVTVDVEGYPPPSLPEA